MRLATGTAAPASPWRRRCSAPPRTCVHAARAVPPRASACSAAPSPRAIAGRRCGTGGVRARDPASAPDRAAPAPAARGRAQASVAPESRSKPSEPGYPLIRLELRSRHPAAAAAGFRRSVERARGRSDRRRRRPERLDVGRVQLAPAIARRPRRRRAVEVMLEIVEARVPAGAVASRLAELVDGVEERQLGAVAVGLDLEADDV